MTMDKPINATDGEPIENRKSEIENSAVAPEVAQLLKLLELQAAAARSDRRAAMPRVFQGVSFRYGSLIVIVLFAFGSVGLMEWMLSQLPRPAHSTGTALPSISGSAARTGIPPTAVRAKPTLEN